MATSRFTPETESVLRASGWFPDRAVSDEILDKWLVVDWKPLGYPPLGYSKIFPAAWRALREFGGLAVIEREGAPPLSEPFILDPLLVVESEPFDTDWLLEEWTLGETLFPIGMIRVNGTLEDPLAPDAMDFALAMSTDGRVFRLGCSTHLVGRNIDEALENLIWQKNLGEEIDESQNNDGLEAFARMKKLIAQRALSPRS